MGERWGAMKTRTIRSYSLKSGGEKMSLAKKIRPGGAKVSYVKTRQARKEDEKAKEK